jgi:formylglycine-generating enzyme required for sulfatase activity
MKTTSAGAGALSNTAPWLLSAALLALLPAAAQARWDESFFNPRPAENDLILPMPCDGAMVLRPVVVVDGGGPLDDRPVDLGTADTNLGFNDFQRRAFLAAPFRGPDGKRQFWIGKYEVTRDQYAALSGKCPEPSVDGRIAQSEVSWLEAVTFAERWTAWLLEHERDKLPQRDQDYAFVRLPTEDEWEYAARGGAAVGDSEFAAKTFPMPEGIERYVIAGSRASEGRPQPIGQVLPNPLGLYDMLGNVAEWVLDAYRARHPDRPDGMIGGLVARGGSYLNVPSELHSAWRVEIPPFDASRNAPTRLRFVGFRVVLASPVGGSRLAVAEALRKAFLALPNRPGAADEGSQKLLEQVKQQTSDNVQLRRKIDTLAASLAAEASARGDAGREALKAQIQGAAALAYTVCRLGRTIKQQELAESAVRDYYRKNPTAPGNDDYRTLVENLGVNRTDRTSSLDAYATLLRQAGSRGTPQELTAVLQILKQEYQQRSDRRLPLLPAVSDQLLAIADRHPPTSDKMLEGIGDLNLCAPPRSTR